MLHEQEEMGSRGRTGASKESLAYEAALDLLDGKSPDMVESGLLARGVYPATEIMDLAIRYAINLRCE